MLLLGHLGITLGAAGALSGVLAVIHPDGVKNKNGPGLKNKQNRGGWVGAFIRAMFKWPLSFANKVDVKILLFGAILPDVIDKPLGFLWLDSGRVFCHTLLFLIIIISIGLYLYKAFNKIALLVVSFGCTMHLILDGMWLTPRTFYWPLLGLSFERLGSNSINGWFDMIIQGLITNPVIYLSEIFGGLIIVALIIRVFREKRWPKVFSCMQHM